MTMVTLWLPVLATAVATFVAGAVIWMAMPWHKNDWSRTENEESVRDALRSTPPGMYTLPHIANRKQMADPVTKQKLIDGPQAFITVIPSGIPQMGGKLLLMFIFNLLVAIVCAYVVSRTAPVGADYSWMFRIAGTVTLVAYGGAYIQESIWFGRSWSLTAKNLLDALIYAAIAGGFFGWLAV